MNHTGRTTTKIDQLRAAAAERWAAAWELIRAQDRLHILAGGGPNDHRAFADALARYRNATSWQKAINR